MSMAAIEKFLLMLKHSFEIPISSVLITFDRRSLMLGIAETVAIAFEIA